MRNLGILILLVTYMGLGETVSAQDNPVALSIKLIEAVYQHQDVSKTTDKLANLSYDDLKSSLNNDNKKKTFWINVYNSYVIIILRQHAELWEDRDSFFKEKRFTIAGEKLSLDDVEHGFLRRSQFKYGLGFIGSVFPGSFEKAMRVDKIDPRIHFALNCGAIACPPVRAYYLESIEDQLQLATQKYLSKVTISDEQNKELKTSPLMSWFRGDFGVLDGPIGALKHFGIISPENDYNVSFLNYDWTMELNNFAGKITQ